MKKRNKRLIIPISGALIAGAAVLVFAFADVVPFGKAQTAQVLGINTGTLVVGSNAVPVQPSSEVIQTEAFDFTDDVELLGIMLAANTGEDITITRLPITLYTSDNAVSDVVSSVTIETADGDTFTKAVAPTIYNNAIVSFSGSGFSIPIDARDKLEATITVNVKPMTAYSNGTTVWAGLTSGNVISIQVRDALGNIPLRSGSVLGNKMALYDNGIVVDLVSATTDLQSGPNANDDVATFTIKFKVTAIGDDVFIPKTISLAPTAPGSHTLRFQNANNAWFPQGTPGTSSTFISTSGASQTLQNFRIDEGESETFQAVFMLNNAVRKQAGSYKTLMTRILWNTSDTTAYSPFTFNLGALATDYLFVN